MKRIHAIVSGAALSLVLIAPEPVRSGSLLFDAPDEHSLGRVSEPIVIADLNGDALLDVVVGNTGGDGVIGIDTVSVLSGLGGGMLGAARSFPAGDRPEGIAVADLDGDGFLDLLAADMEGDTVAVLRGDGAGGFLAPSYVPVPGSPRFVVAADLNDDGAADMATANFGGDSVSIFRGTGGGDFLPIETHPVGNGPEVLAAGRLNRDASLDLVTCNAADGTITPLLNTGAGHFLPGASHPVGSRPRFVLAADIDSDGLDDLMVANSFSDSIGLEKNLGDGSFLNAGSLSYSSPGTRLESPVYLAFQDITGDGRADVLATWADSDMFSVFPGAPGLFAFGPPSIHATGRVPVGIAAADLDGDGLGDVVVTGAFDDSCRVFRTKDAVQGVVVDDGSPGTSLVGVWSESSAPFAYGSSSVYSKDGARYTWQATLPEPGVYEALMWWTVTSNRSASVPVQVSHQGATTSLLLDQRRGVGTWSSLGTYAFGTTASVTLIAPRGTASVSADAVRFRPRRDLRIPTQRGNLVVAARAEPLESRLDDERVLAFHGTIAASEAAEPEDWKGIVVAPVGPGVETTRISTLRLYVDENSNGRFDAGDSELGTGVSLGADSKATAFLGFSRSIEPRRSVDFFLVCDGVQEGPRDLQLEVISVIGAGVATGTPCAVSGLPARGWMFPVESSSGGGRQLPADTDQDGELDLADPLALLNILFRGSVARLPCGDRTLQDASNVRLLDANGDARVNLTDAVLVLTYLFGGGDPPALGTDCVKIPGCADNGVSCL